MFEIRFERNKTVLTRVKLGFQYKKESFRPNTLRFGWVKCKHILLKIRK